MADTELADLLNDARLVIDYAVRVGRLPDGTLPEALHAVESAAPESVAATLPALAAALNSAILSIAPMGLLELRSGRSPFDPRNQRSIRALQALFCAFTIALTIAVAGLTERLHRQDTALKALQQIQETHPLEKLNALRKMVQFDAALDKQDAVRYEQYHRGISELRDLQDRLTGSYALLASLAQAGWLGVSVQSSSPGAVIQAYSTKDATKYAALESQLEDGTKPARTEMVAVFDDCGFEDGDGAGGGTKSPAWLRHVVADSAEESCFSRNLNLLLNLPPTSLFYQVKASMETLNGWVLPFLYGLLGAAVFVMRSLLDPRTPIMGFFPSIVRVALGGIAGIIIGWFWVPAAFAAGAVASVSSLPFGLAFLGGFSIDILFSILDRLGRTVSQANVPKAA